LTGRTALKVFEEGMLVVFEVRGMRWKLAMARSRSRGRKLVELGKEKLQWEHSWVTTLLKLAEEWLPSPRKVTLRLLLRKLH
jgi:hypothetical protein